MSKTINGYLQETMEEAGLTHLMTKGDGTHILRNEKTKELEVWANSKGFAGHTVKYKNTELEFCSTLPKLGK